MSEQSLINEASWLEIALDIAQQAHLGQKRRGGNTPYITHPVRVYSITKRFKYSRLVQIAAILHDAIEDAPDPRFIEREINRRIPRVLPIVKSLTHNKDGSVRYVDYATSLEGPSLQLKLSDMLHNLLDDPSDRQRVKYAKALQAIGKKNQGKPKEIKKEHWRILLNQVDLTPREMLGTFEESKEPHLLRQYIRLFVETKMIPEAQERFNLRQTSQEILTPVFFFVDKAIKHENYKIHKNFFVRFTFDGDSAHIRWINGSGEEEVETETINTPLIARLDETGRFDIEITVRPGEEMHIDANYLWDPDDDVHSVESDLGGIDLSVIIPSDLTAFNEDKDHIFRHSRGTLAHELQHIIQRAIYDRHLSLHSKSDLLRHIRDPDEIDARVEEILAFCENELSTCDTVDFRKELEDHVVHYLTRNGIAEDDPNFAKWKREMIDSHLIRFREKFELWG